MIAFERLGPAQPSGPVVVAVPHAGRDYRDFAAQLRVAPGRLIALEDRHAERLAETATAHGTPAIVARMPRAWIDLNRAESDLDPAMIAGRMHQPLSPRARGGLGLIPRRLIGVGDLWWSALSPVDLAARVEQCHRPYHAAISTTLAEARARFGAAVLIDLHSMPSLPGPDAADVVIGDAFGRAATSLVAEIADAALTRAGLNVAINAPYAGGHTLARHGAPARGVHAIQLEFDRRLYLDADGIEPGPGLPAMQNLVATLVAELESALSPNLAIAAE